MGEALAELGAAVARPAGRAMSWLTASRAVWAAATIAAAGWASVAALRVSLFITGRYNTGDYVQAIWATAHGHFLQVTEIGGSEVSRLGVHVDPIIVLFAPLWWLWPSPLLLLTVQAIALALGAIPLFWLARKHLPREKDAAFLAIAYLISPTVAWNAVTSFNAVAFAVPLLLFAFWYLDENRLLPFAMAAGAAMLCQEQIGLIVGCLGLWYAWRRGRLKPGLVIAAAGFALSAFDVLVVLRHFSGGSPFAARYGTPTSVLRDLFTHPLRLAHRLSSHDLNGFFVAAPVLGICFGSPILLAVLPQVALLLLSRRPSDWDVGGSNLLVLVPFVYVATTLTLGRWARKSGGRPTMFGAGHVFLVSLVALLLWGPFTTLPAHAPVSAARVAVSLVPANASVSTTDDLALPLAARRQLYVFPVRKNADWVLVNSRAVGLPDMSYLHRRTEIEFSARDLYRQPNLMRRELRQLRESPTWRLVYHRASIYVFKGSQEARPAAIGTS